MGIWDWNITSGEVWCSIKFYELLGYTDNEVELTYNLFINVLIHPNDKQLMLDAIQNYLEHKALLKVTIRIQTKHEDYRWFEIYGKARLDNESVATRTIGSMVDNSEQKNLHDLNNKYKLMLADTEGLIKIGSCDINLLTGEQIWSKGFQDIFEVDDLYALSLEKSNNLYNTFNKNQDAKGVGLHIIKNQIEPSAEQFR